MAWNLKGSYVETCSCDLMCPCNATFDHGATYDYCRVTLGAQAAMRQYGLRACKGITGAPES